MATLVECQGNLAFHEVKCRNVIKPRLKIQGGPSRAQRAGDRRERAPLDFEVGLSVASKRRFTNCNFQALFSPFFSLFFPFAGVLEHCLTFIDDFWAFSVIPGEKLVTWQKF